MNAAKTRPANRRAKGHELTLNLRPIPQEHLDACARVFARLAVAKALKELGLDSGPTVGDNVGNQHKAAPASATTLTEAKE